MAKTKNLLEITGSISLEIPVSPKHAKGLGLPLSLGMLNCIFEPVTEQKILIAGKLIHDTLQTLGNPYCYIHNPPRKLSNLPITQRIWRYEIIPTKDLEIIRSILLINDSEELFFFSLTTSSIEKLDSAIKAKASTWWKLRPSGYAHIFIENTGLAAPYFFYDPCNASLTVYSFPRQIFTLFNKLYSDTKWE